MTLQLESSMSWQMGQTPPVGLTQRPLRANFLGANRAHRDNFMQFISRCTRRTTIDIIDETMLRCCLVKIDIGLEPSRKRGTRV